MSHPLPTENGGLSKNKQENNVAPIAGLTREGIEQNFKQFMQYTYNPYAPVNPMGSMGLLFPLVYPNVQALSSQLHALSQIKAAVKDGEQSSQFAQQLLASFQQAQSLLQAAQTAPVAAAVPQQTASIVQQPLQQIIQPEISTKIAIKETPPSNHINPSEATQKTEASSAPENLSTTTSTKNVENQNETSEPSSSPSHPVDPEIEAFAQSLIESLVEESIDKELKSVISTIAAATCTEAALEYHAEKKKRNKTAPPKKTVVQDETDVSEEEDSETNLDYLRSSTLKEWNHVLAKYQWRWDWLEIKMSQLQNELEETEELLHEIQEAKKKHMQAGGASSARVLPFSSVNSLGMVKKANLSTKNYPPEQRRRDIRSHPLFGLDHEVKGKTSRPLTKEDIQSSLRLFSSSYPPKKKGKMQKRKPKNLQLSIPNPSISSTTSTPSSARKSASNSGRKKSSANRSQYDIDDYVVPWTEIHRNNAPIVEVKPKEIITPKWKQVMRPFHDINFAINVQPPEALSEEEDEDISDDFYAKLHLPLEIEERRRACPLLEKARKKKKKEEQNKENAENESQSSSAPSTHEKGVLKNHTPRYLLVTYESYKRVTPPALNNPRGNYDEMKRLDLERQAKLKEEQEKIAMSPPKPSAAQNTVKYITIEDEYLEPDAIIDEEADPLGGDDGEFAPPTDDSDFEGKKKKKKKRKASKSAGGRRPKKSRHSYNSDNEYVYNSEDEEQDAQYDEFDIQTMHEEPEESEEDIDDEFNFEEIEREHYTRAYEWKLKLRLSTMRILLQKHDKIPPAPSVIEVPAT